MRSDDQIRLAGSYLGISFFLFFCGHGACQQYRPEGDAVFPDISCDRFKMLDGQYFRGSHQSALITVGSTHEQGEHCQNRFSGADITLNQAVHGVRTSHVLP